MEDVEGDEEGTEDAKKDEEVVDSQLAPFYGCHYGILVKLPHFVFPESF